LAAFLAGWVPAAPVAAVTPGAAMVASAADNTLTSARSGTIAAAVDPHLPSIVLQIGIAPDPIAVGDTAVLTVTVTNQDPDPANDLVITAPTPDGALALPGPNTVTPTRGWRWSQPRLEGNNSSLVLTGTLRLVRNLPGDALILAAQATVRGIATPITVSGGAVVVDRARGPVTVPFTPGAATVLRSSDGRLTLAVPARVAARRLTLRHTPRPTRGVNSPPAIVGYKRGLGAFTLDATDDQGTDVHEFTEPLTLTLTYTPEQLQALGIAEDNLTLFWFNTDTQQWEPISTSIDPVAHTATAYLTHFTNFNFADGSSPSAAFIPSLQGWQVSTYTGAATYSYPIEVPASAGGLKPALSLNYNSSATDDSAGTRDTLQSSWVGKGWSLDTGSIALNKINGNITNYFSMVLNGQSFDLIRTNPITTGTDITDPTMWVWRPTDESFVRVRAISNGVSTTSRGGYKSSDATQPYKRYTWQVWTKDGTRYDFKDDAWWGWESCPGYAYMEAYKWQLTQVTDTHGNTISYTYGRASITHLDEVACFHIRGTVDWDIWPISISWGANPTNGITIDRYKVDFSTSSRGSGIDDAFEQHDNQYPDNIYGPHETQRLDSIQVQSYVAGSWQLVRQYILGHASTLTSDGLVCTGSSCATNTATKLALTSIRRTGKNGTLLPLTTFGYGGFAYTTGASGTNYPAGNWNRLTTVNNGQGGTLTFTYDSIGALLDKGLFVPNRRVSSKTVTDGVGHTYTWNYSYGAPNYNTLGVVRGQQAPSWWGNSYYGPQDYPNSAALYYNAFYDQVHNYTTLLVHRNLKEFRGHNWVIETDQYGTKTRHMFYQGEAVDPAGTFSKCIPSITGPNILTGLCFQKLQDGEFFKGREYLTQVFANGVPADDAHTPLHETKHTFAVAANPPVEYTVEPKSGIWRSFVYEAQTDEKTYEGVAGLVVDKMTKYFYDESGYQPGGTNAPYGNLTHMEEYDGATLIRKTEHFYDTLDTSTSYIVDHPWADVVRGGSGNLRALTHYFYDTANTAVNTVGAKGELTRVAKYYNLPVAASAANVMLMGRDVTYIYDAFGNRLTETTYAGPGTRKYDGGSVWTITAPGCTTICSAARMVTTSYDDPSTPTVNEATSGLPRQITQPPATTGASPMSESAQYDYRMGTLTSVNDVNGALTSAAYDEYGRMFQLFKPGDVSFPTVQATYDDFAYQNFGQPFRYKVERRELANQAGVRMSQQFYDGLGRKIQTKDESSDGSGNPINIVTDMRYDGLNQQIEVSQPRYDTENTGFETYLSPGLTTTPLYKSTVTSYDALGRPSTITPPDGKTTAHFYLVWNDGGTPRVAHNVLDANQHRTKYSTDALGRLVKVEEVSGNCGQFGQVTYSCAIAPYTIQWTAYAATAYDYSALDQLTQVTAANGITNTMEYDSLGRKSNLLDTAIPAGHAMHDPDMGDWDYTYDVNGNLLSQSDARHNRVCFFYDDLNRLIGKHAQTDVSACAATFPNLSGDASYSYDQGTNGKGQRTAMRVVGTVGAQTDWQYDARGHMTNATYTNVPGLPSPATRVFDWVYDSADRVQTLTYPAIGAAAREIVTYSYDAGWRPISACSSIPGQACYVTSASYSALDQPKQWNFGNSAIQSWGYDTSMQRLTQLQVGISGNLGSMLNRSYSYDNVGNLASITEGTQQAFDYDHRDRLVHMGPLHMAGLGMLASLDQAAPAINGLIGMPSPVLASASAPDAAVAALNDLRHADQSPDRAQQLGESPSVPGGDAHADRAQQALASMGVDSRLQAPAAPLGNAATAANAPSTPQPRPDFGWLPLAFVPNQGQTDAQARFLVHGAGGTLFFTPGEAVLTLPDPSDTVTTTVVRLRYVGANASPTISARSALPGVVNYLTGGDSTKWRTNVPTYAGISYGALYGGIDLNYDGTDGKLKSTYVVAPNADPSQIRWRYLGARDLQINASTGDLIITLGGLRRGRMLTEHAPLAWQDIAGTRVPVSARFDVAANGSVGFALGSYDHSQPLTIDPILTYSTYHGGNRDDKATAIVVDSSGQAIVAGYTTSNTGFPLLGALFASYRGNTDAFVSKFNAAGSALVFSTYLGGSNEDKANAITLDPSGNIVIAGETASGGATPFPTVGAMDSSFASGGACSGGTCKDVFLSKLNAAGSSLLYSTFFGGTGVEEANGVAADSGSIYATGIVTATGMTTKNYYDNSFNGSTDAFLIKVNPSVSGSTGLQYSTYLGGSSSDEAKALALGSSGKVYLTGDTTSSNYPTLGAYQGSNAGGQDAFVTAIDTTLSGASSLKYSTYLGGSATDEGDGIVLDASSNAYITGSTTSSAWPTKTAWQSTNNGDHDAILTEINPAATGAASLVYSTYLGGIRDDRGQAIARDSSGVLYLTGYTTSITYPTTLAVQPTFGGGTCGTISCTDVFVTAFDLAVNSPVYSTFLGNNTNDQGLAIAADSSGAAYVAGYSDGSFPTASPRQATSGGQRDAFVAKLSQPTWSLGAATASVAEGTSPLNLTVTLSAAAPMTTTVAYTTANGSATAGSDYLAQAGTLVFVPNQTSATINIPIVDDGTDEPNETFSVTLSNPSGGRLGSIPSTTVTITDNDAPPTVTWENTAVSVGEPSGSALVAVNLSVASAFTVTVAYATSAGTATAGSDYTTSSGTLTFAPGVSTRTVSIPIINDSAPESSETIILTLSSPTNATLGAATTTLTILDDETPAPLGDEIYQYDLLGNIVSKTGVGTYSYSAAHPHAVTSAGPFGFGYDANGNMTTAGGQITTWDAENRPTSIYRVSGSETYVYDADGERIGRTAGYTTTVFLGGMWQEDVAGGAVGLTRVLYGFNGATVAQRAHVTTPAGDSVIYLHGDHLGSVSVVTGASATLLGSQRFDPWGKVIAGGTVNQTRMNYTGQELDTTSLLYYHARYYDPNLGRFLSADTVVPGSASGSMDGVALKPLTVDFHEPGFAAALNGENNQPFWFQLSDKERGKAGSPWGPTNPQALNRYSYVLNNPLKYTDPNGHCGGSILDNLGSVFNGSCLSMAATIWKNTEPGTGEHTLAATYIGLSAVALVYGGLAGGKLIYAAGAASTSGAVAAAQTASDLSRYGTTAQNVGAKIASYSGSSTEHLNELLGVLLRRQAHRINQLQNVEQFAADAINAAKIDLADANSAIEAINRLLK